MTKPDDAAAENIRQMVLQTAFDELVDRGIDRFTVDRVRKRADVEPDLIITMWGGRRILLMDAVLSSSESVIPIPDTGTLRGDLAMAFEAAVSIASTREGRDPDAGRRHQFRCAVRRQSHRRRLRRAGSRHVPARSCPVGRRPARYGLSHE
ncbi:MAG: hypothetical protein KDB72_10365 [Mycobacterium sp.]|nr:hypothetical protein [Mycobacterium sp.]